ncbi:taurine dioxygenase [Novosphingobium sp. Rr 2-17]|uniref:TauD/TfdA dioxygenase family protein n=1 Tax=Novosphingobium sp. Rr 2-17 TaxID=555793 RepID=UPI00026994C6|nr:TauD/TfdA family dioxygenase [Novosphingobium sp. Rr 2-17]EIZ81022.1 taurine dioxygenase [Novosphingobium sp. Rr 2-17]
MEYSSITVTPLTPGIGGVISGVDLTQPLSNAQVDDLHKALDDRLVIFFRDQQIDHEDHKRFANYFGGIHIAPSTKPWQVPGHPEVTKMHADGDSKFVAGEDWHTDMSCDEAPPLGSVLYLHTIPPVGGDTIFANMYDAYEALSDRMKAYLEGMTAIHDSRQAFGDITPDGMELPRSSHPVIRTHPSTGRKSLYVNRGFTTKLEGVSRAESDAVLAFLFDHLQHPIYQCRFAWQPHSIAFWDNRCSQHVATWDYFPQVRSGYRIQILGDRPF